VFPSRRLPLAGGNPVVLYAIFSWSLIVIVAVTLLWPLNVFLMALAFKVRHGQEKIDMEPREFWWRMTFAALGLAALTLVLLGLAYGLIAGAELPRHIIHLVLFMVYLPAGVWFLHWVLAFDDVLQALSVFLLYFLLPLLPLLLAGRLFRLMRVVENWTPWLLPPSS